MYEKQDHIKIYFMLILAEDVVLDMDQQVAKKMTIDIHNKLYSGRKMQIQCIKPHTVLSLSHTDTRISRPAGEGYKYMKILFIYRNWLKRTSKALGPYLQ